MSGDEERGGRTCRPISCRRLARKSLFNNDRRADLGVLEKFLRHACGHTDTSVRCRVSGKESGMHANTVVEAHEIRHRCAFEILARSGLVNTDIGIVINGFFGCTVLDDSVN